MTCQTGPFVLGLTGSIAMGKSTVAAMFADAGVPVFDADAEVRAMQGPDGALVKAIEERFPGSTGPEGVDRQMLGAIVFGNGAKLAELEGLIHPAVARRRADFLAANAAEPLVLFDIPLLFEKTGMAGIDAVLVVSAPAHTQRARALAREGMTEEKLDQILAFQLPDAEKRARADYIINTGGTLAETQHQVETLVEKLRADLNASPA